VIKFTLQNNMTIYQIKAKAAVQSPYFIRQLLFVIYANTINEPHIK